MYQSVKEKTTLKRKNSIWVPYARHYNPLLIRNRSWILTIHKAGILRKNPLEKTFVDFKKWVKSIETVGYNVVRTVLQVRKVVIEGMACQPTCQLQSSDKLCPLLQPSLIQRCTYLYFVNWHSGELSNKTKIWLLKPIFYVQDKCIFSDSFLFNNINLIRSIFCERLFW